MVLEARRLAKEQEGTGANEMLKLLTPNQVLKRLTNGSCTSKSW